MHYNNKFKESVFSRRAFILILLQLVAFLIIALRLFFLQILKSNEYKSLSDRNRIKLLLLEPKRGTILDRNKHVIAENKINYRLYFYKQRDVNFVKILERICSILALPPEQKQSLYNTIKNANYIYPIVIEENLSWDHVAKIGTNLYTLPGVYIDKGHARFYPLEDVCVHVIGYMGSPSPAQVKDYKLFNNKEFRVGKSGLEKTFDNNLIGKFGSKKVEVNANRVVIRELSHEKSTSGNELNVALDSRLQKFVFNSIPKEGAAVIVMDIQNGEVLSMVSTPTFNPNLFSTPISTQDWNQILHNKSQPFANKAIGKLYPPGSIWKIVAALAMLEHGVDPKKQVLCAGEMTVGDRICRCTKAHGYVDLERAMTVSCNVYFYEKSLIIGVDKMHSIASVLGFGNKTEVELPGELSGINPSKLWKKKIYDDNWRVGDTINASIGQGYIATTPLQLTTMIARVASGKKITPTLILNNERGAQIDALKINPEHLQTVKNSLSKVFNSSEGTGYGARITNKEFMMAGKTGTAQVIAGDTAASKIRNVKSHSIFTGYAPVHSPKYAITVVVDHAGWGSKTATPLGRDILYFAQNNLQEA